MKRLLGALLGAATLTFGLAGGAPSATAQEGCTIALIPGLTTDAFYITMRKGAEMAAKAVGCELLFQGAPDFNPTTQVPVLQAVIARKPDAILTVYYDSMQGLQSRGITVAAPPNPISRSAKRWGIAAMRHRSINPHSPGWTGSA